MEDEEEGKRRKKTCGGGKAQAIEDPKGQGDWGGKATSERRFGKGEDRNARRRGE